MDEASGATSCESNWAISQSRAAHGSVGWQRLGEFKGWELKREATRKPHAPRPRSSFSLKPCFDYPSWRPREDSNL